jgi:peptidase E
MSRLRLDLMATPGEGFHRVLRPADEILATVADRCIGYMPSANIDPGFYFDWTKQAFAGRADVVLLDPVNDTPAAFLRALDRSSLLYVPGGNTFVLVHRLRAAGLFGAVADRLRWGLPLIGFSAGAVMCGLDILNSMDVNAPGLSDFAGLAVVPYSLNVHYPAPDDERKQRDERIAYYRSFNDRPVLALEDDAHISVRGDRWRLVEGTAWLFSESGRSPYRGPTVDEVPLTPRRPGGDA